MTRGTVLLGLFGSLLMTATAVAQSAVVVAVQADGVLVNIAQAPDLQPGTRVGFVRIANARREVAQGAIVRLNPGTALVTVTSGGPVQPGDLLIRCPAPSVDAERELVSQLERQVAQLGSADPDVRVKVGLLRSVLDAKEVAVRAGVCDVSDYDAWGATLAGELQQAVARSGSTTVSAPPISPGATVAMPPSASPPTPLPPALTTVPPATGMVDPAQSGQGSALDTIGKIGQAFGSLLGSTGAGGASAGFGGSPTIPTGVIPFPPGSGDPAPITPSPGGTTNTPVNPPVTVVPTPGVPPPQPSPPTTPPGTSPGGLRPGPPKVILPPSVPAVLGPPPAIAAPPAVLAPPPVIQTQPVRPTQPVNPSRTLAPGQLTAPGVKRPVQSP